LKLANIRRGVDFDDPDSGYKEEDKDDIKVRKPMLLRYCVDLN
jgi:hypothetical protein